MSALSISKKTTSNSGFTLIELMVVVAIIAILSTIGIGGFSSAQKKARDARRRADVKTIQSTMVSASDINGIPDGFSAMREIGGKYPEDPSGFPYLIYAPLSETDSDLNGPNGQLIIEDNKFTKDKTASIVYVRNTTNNVGIVCATLETADTGNTADFTITANAGKTPPSGTNLSKFSVTIGQSGTLSFQDMLKAVVLTGDENDFSIKPCIKGPNQGENCNLFCATF